MPLPISAYKNKLYFRMFLVRRNTHSYFNPVDCPVGIISWGCYSWWSNWCHRRKPQIHEVYICL